MFDTIELENPRNAALATIPSNTRPVDPNGWDVVSAVRIGDINTVIRNAGTSPTSFSANPVEGATIAGSFDPWAISPDGNGLLINLAVPIKNVAVSYRGMNAVLAEGVAQVRVHLQYMPAGPRMMAAPGGGEQEVETHLLVLKIAPHAGVLGTGEDARVAQVLSVDGGRAIPTRLYSVLKVGLDQWFNANLAAFQHVFATVNIVKTAHDETEGGFDWLVPSTVSYAFGHNAETPEDSILSILCMTGGRKGDGLIAQAQADMIPQGANAALCISRQRIAHDMIGRGLPLAFDGLEASDLLYSSKDTAVSVKKRLKLDNVKDEKGKSYSPYLQRMMVHVGETEVKLESETHTEITKGVWSIINTIDTYTYGLTENSKKQKTMAFKQLSHDDKKQTKQDKDATIIEWVARGLALVGMVVLGFVTGGVAIVVAAIVAALLIGTITRDAIKLISGNDGPPIDLMLTNASQAVSWSTASRFDPIFAGLNGGLQIGGITGDTGLLGAEDPSAAQRQFQAPFASLMASRAGQTP